MTLHVQFVTMLAMVAGGIYLGMALDTFRRFSHHWQQRVFLRYMLEILFWLSQTSILFYWLFQFNAGELRIYIFLSVLLGFAMYQALFAKIYRMVLEFIINIIKHIFYFIYRLIDIFIIGPIRFIVQSCLRLATLLLRVVQWIIVSLAYVVWSILKWPSALLWRMLPEKFKKRLYKTMSFCSILKDRIVRWFRKITRKWR